MKSIKELVMKETRTVYIHTPSIALAKDFLKQAEKEGFLFGDGKRPTKKPLDDYYALRVELLCGNKKDYIYTSIDKNGNCVGDNCKTETKKEENKDNNKSETTNKNDNKI